MRVACHVTHSRARGERVEKAFVIALEADIALGKRRRGCSHLKCFTNQLFAGEMALLPWSLFPSTAEGTWAAAAQLR